MKGKFRRDITMSDGSDAIPNEHTNSMLEISDTHVYLHQKAGGVFGGRDGWRPRVWRHSGATTPMRRRQAAASSPPAHEEPAHLAGLLLWRHRDVPDHL